MAAAPFTSSVTKRADASTLSVVNLVKENLPKFQAALPRRTSRSASSSTSRPIVTRAIRGLVEEGVLGAVLTGLMVCYSCAIGAALWSSC